MLTVGPSRTGIISGFGAWEEKTEGYSVVINSTRTKVEHFPYYPLVAKVLIAPELNCSANSLLLFIRFEFFVGGYISYYKYYDGMFKTICHVSFSNQKKEVSRPLPTDSGGPLVSWSGENEAPELWGIILKNKNKFLYEEAEFYVFLSVAQYQTWIYSVMDSY